MASAPVAPAAGTDVIELVSATEHLLPVGEVTEIEDEPQLETRYASASNPSGLATTDERCCRALMRAAQRCKGFARDCLTDPLMPGVQKIEERGGPPHDLPRRRV